MSRENDIGGSGVGGGGGSDTGSSSHPYRKDHNTDAVPTEMADDDLDLLQLSDSLFPTGMFATSNGLELIVSDNMITNREELLSLCTAIRERQTGPTDCVLLANAYDNAHDTTSIEELDAICRSTKTVREVREAAIRSGVQLCRCVAEFCDDPIITRHLDCIGRGRISGIYPVSLGLCCRVLKIRKERALLILLYGFAASMAGAALRLGAIQHFEAQKLIHELKPIIRRAVATHIDGQTDDIWQFCPHAEILQMAHERMDAKMFIT